LDRSAWLSTATHPGRRAARRARCLVFEGANEQLKYRRLFGGQLLGQFIRAACLTCPDKTVKSLHEVFAREGGRSFAALTITARQPRGVLATSSVCMHAAEDGPEHQSVGPFWRCWMKTSGRTGHLDS
jgi:acyl-CoA thioesterase II